MSVIQTCPDAYHAARRAGRFVARQFPKLWGTQTAVELDAQARLLYVEAIHKWDTRGSLPKWVYQHVRRHLLNYVRTEIRWSHGRGIKVWGVSLTQLPARPEDDFPRRLSELSRPAQEVAGLLFSNLRPDGSPGTKPCNIKARVTRTLKTRGWTRNRLNQVFTELKGVVT